MKYKAVKIVGSFLKRGWGATKSWAAPSFGAKCVARRHTEKAGALYVRGSQCHQKHANYYVINAAGERTKCHSTVSSLDAH